MFFNIYICVLFFFFSCRFCIQLRDVLTDSVILPVTTILVIYAITGSLYMQFVCMWKKYSSVSCIFQKNFNTSNQHILPSLISGLGCLARDDVIRHKLAHDPDCWKAFLVAVVSNGYTFVSFFRKVQIAIHCVDVICQRN